jgi:hypothetical protein
MNSNTLNIIALVLLGSCALSSCGSGSGSPSVSFSASSLTFGDEVEGSASEPLLITLTNTSTAPLIITSIAASANFAQTNNCGSTLAAGANCAINVTLAANTTGSLTGTVTFTDNAADSPQVVSLKGTAVTPSTLTGVCVGLSGDSPNLCSFTNNPNNHDCPVGKPAAAPTLVHDCHGAAAILDTSARCFLGPSRDDFGYCQATSSVLSCSVQGQQCGGTLPGCCSGFTCTAGADGSSCQPAAGANDSRARSSLGLADTLR